MKPSDEPPPNESAVSSPSGAARHIISLIERMQAHTDNASAGARTGGDSDSRHEADTRNAALADVLRMELLTRDADALDTTFSSTKEFLEALLRELQFCEEGVAHTLIAHIQNTLGVTTTLFSPRELLYEKRIRYLASVTTLGEKDIRNRLGRGTLTEAVENQRMHEIEARFERPGLRATGS